MMKSACLVLVVCLAAVLLAGTLRDPHFWRTPDQRGDALFRAGRFAEAARTYTDPARIGVAQYRHGDFEAAAKTFARVPGAEGAFDQGNAWLMHGDYDAAIASYDRALGFRADWKDAKENEAIARARQARLKRSGEDRQESADAYEPDEIAFDQKGGDQKGQPVELAQQELSDDELRATWLRHVRTTPADFLRAKFAYQAAHANQTPEDAK